MRRTLFAFATAVSLCTAGAYAHDRDGWFQDWKWDRDDDRGGRGHHGDRDDDDRHGAIGSFRPLATLNVPGGTSAEIISASRDGRFLVYSDAIGEKFGLVNIVDPRNPKQVATLPANGSPTSVAVLPVGNYAIGCVQPGRLILIDLTTFTVVGEKAIGEGPDSVAVTKIGNQVVAVIAIENEGDLPKGYVEVVRLNLSNFAASQSATVRFDDEAALTKAGLIAVSDPQPEFVSIRGTKVAVTLQENNGIAILDIANPAAPRLVRVFNAGVVDNRPADLKVDETISFTDTFPADVIADVPTAGTRIPDAIAWTKDGDTLFTADEGEEDYEGGRGWSAHSPLGYNLYDDGGSMERTAVQFGHYPEGRSDAKGIEAEGLAVAEYGDREFLFVSSERGAFLSVYRVDGSRKPKFVQILSTGQGPEGVLPLPSRNLLITANEGDDADGSISIFQGVKGGWDPSEDLPVIVSGGADEPWGAISGLAPSLHDSRLLYAIPDNALPSELYTIETGDGFARIRAKATITRNGTPMRYDLEGITPDLSIEQPRRDPGFWLANEGDAATTKNLLIQIDGRGRVLREIALPAAVDAPGGLIRSNGFEGVAVSRNGRYLLVAVQRPFVGDAARVGGLEHTRIARYDLKLEKWETFFYPLVDSPGTIGLSEIALVGVTRRGDDVYAVIERDNRLAGSANLKRLYTFTLDGLTPVDVATPISESTLPGSTVTKTLLRDVLGAFTPYEKVEGLTLTINGDLWVALDNDGGEFESRLVKIRRPFAW